MKLTEDIRRENLLIAIGRVGTAAALAEAAGTSPAYLSQIVNRTPDSKTGKPKSMGSSVARKIEKAIKEAEGWMDVEHTSASADKQRKETSGDFIGGLKAAAVDTLGEEELPHPTEDEFAYVYQLDIAAACGNGRFEDHVVVKGGLAFKRSSLRDFGVPENAARIIYASGGSMSPTIQDGRVVLLNLAEREPVDNKIYAICMPDGGLVLKRLLRDYHPTSGSSVWVIRSDNADKTQFPDKILPPDDRTMIVGRAVWTDSVL